MDFGKHRPKTYLIIYKVIAIKIIMIVHYNDFFVKIAFLKIIDYVTDNN